MSDRHKRRTGRRIGQAVDEGLCRRIGGAAQGQRQRPQAKLEQAVAAPGLEVVLAFGRRLGDQVDLPRIEPEALIDRAGLRLDRALVGQEDALRAAFDDGRRDGAVGDVGQRLGREDDGDVLLAQHLQPFADAGGEQRVVEVHPRLVQDQQRRPAVEAGFQAVEQVGQQRQNDAGLAHQRLGLEGLHVGQGEPVLGGIQQAAKRPLQGVGCPRWLRVERDMVLLFHRRAVQFCRRLARAVVGRVIPAVCVQKRVYQ